MREQWLLTVVMGWSGNLNPTCLKALRSSTRRIGCEIIRSVQDLDSALPVNCITDLLANNRGDERMIFRRQRSSDLPRPACHQANRAFRHAIIFNRLQSFRGNPVISSYGRVQLIEISAIKV